MANITSVTCSYHEQRILWRNMLHFWNERESSTYRNFAKRVHKIYFAIWSLHSTTIDRKEILGLMRTSNFMISIAANAHWENKIRYIYSREQHTEHWFKNMGRSYLDWEADLSCELQCKWLVWHSDGIHKERKNTISISMRSTEYIFHSINCHLSAWSSVKNIKTT